MTAPASRDSARWYAVSTRSRHEQVVRDQLVRKDVQAFLPTVTQWSRWKDRKKQIEWPLFPGYCFARFDVADRLDVLRCAGVLRIVSVAGTPASVPDIEVNNLRVLVENPTPSDPCPFLRDGQMVRVNAGPLCGVVGRLLRKDFRHATVVISVDLIGQAVRVEVHAADLSGASVAAPGPSLR